MSSEKGPWGGAAQASKEERSSLAEFEGGAWGSGPRPLRRALLLVPVSLTGSDKVGPVSVSRKLKRSSGCCQVGLLLLGRGITAS